MRKPALRNCAICGEEFVPSTPNHISCSLGCQSKLRLRTANRNWQKNHRRDNEQKNSVGKET